MMQIQAKPLFSNNLNLVDMELSNMPLEGGTPLEKNIGEKIEFADVVANLPTIDKIEVIPGSEKEVMPLEPEKKCAINSMLSELVGVTVEGDNHETETLLKGGASETPVELFLKRLQNELQQDASLMMTQWELPLLVQSVPTKGIIDGNPLPQDNLDGEIFDAAQLQNKILTPSVEISSEIYFDVQDKLLVSNSEQKKNLDVCELGADADAAIDVNNKHGFFDANLVGSFLSQKIIADSGLINSQSNISPKDNISVEDAVVNREVISSDISKNKDGSVNISILPVSEQSVDDFILQKTQNIADALPTELAEDSFDKNNGAEHIRSPQLHSNDFKNKNASSLPLTSEASILSSPIVPQKQEVIDSSKNKMHQDNPLHKSELVSQEKITVQVSQERIAIDNDDAQINQPLHNPESSNKKDNNKTSQYLDKRFKVDELISDVTINSVKNVSVAVSQVNKVDGVDDKNKEVSFPYQGNDLLRDVNEVVSNRKQVVSPILLDAEGPAKQFESAQPQQVDSLIKAEYTLLSPIEVKSEVAASETNRQRDAVLFTLKLNDPELPTKLQQNINSIITENMQQAEIQLEPLGLGKIKIKIQLNAEQQANVQMVVQHNQTRELLEQSIPRLRDLLAGQGISLGQTQIQQNLQQQGEHHQGNHRSATAIVPMSEENSRSAVAVTTGSSKLSGIDYYA